MALSTYVQPATASVRSIALEYMPSVRWGGTWFLVSAEGNAFGRVARNVVPCIGGGQCVRSSGEERGSLYPRRVALLHIRKMSFTNRLVPYIREPQHVRGYVTALRQIIFTATSYLFDHRCNDYYFTTSYNFCFSELHSFRQTLGTLLCSSLPWANLICRSSVKEEDTEF